ISVRVPSEQVALVGYPMIDASGELVATLPIARRYQKVHARPASEVRSWKVLNQLLSNGVEALFGNRIIRERRVAIERVPYDLSRLRKVPAQHWLRGHKTLQNHAGPAPPSFVVAEVEGLVFANAAAGVGAELVIGKSRSAGSGAEELACLERAVPKEIVRYAMEGVTAAFAHHVGTGCPVSIGRDHKVGAGLNLREDV